MRKCILSFFELAPRALRFVTKAASCRDKQDADGEQNPFPSALHIVIVTLKRAFRSWETGGGTRIKVLDPDP